MCARTTRPPHTPSLDALPEANACAEQNKLASVIGRCKTQGRTTYSEKSLTDIAPEEEGHSYSEYHKIALGHYNSAAQFNARSLIVVVFGQFAILALLETWPVLWLTYLLIMPLGCYFILNYLMFAQFIEELRKYDGTAKLTTLEKHMIDKIKDRWAGLSWLRSGRRSILKCPGLNLIASAAYVIISAIVLWATMSLGAIRPIASMSLSAIQPIATVVATIATVAIVYYAKATIDEGKKNRSKDTLENKLSQLYNPLFEILSTTKDQGRQTGSTTTFLCQMELIERMRRIFEGYSYYLSSEEREKIKAAIYPPGAKGTPLRAYELDGQSFETALSCLKDKRELLNRELRELTQAE